MAILEPTGQPSSALLVLCACPHSLGERGPGCWCAFIPGACWDELWQTGNDPSLSPLFKPLLGPWCLEEGCPHSIPGYSRSLVLVAQPLFVTPVLPLALLYWMVLPDPSMISHLHTWCTLSLLPGQLA